MKALILAAGRGERMGDLTKDTNKCLLPIKGKHSFSALDHVMYEIPYFEDVIDEIVVVVGYKKEKVKERVTDTFFSIPVTYVEQDEPKGMVDALRCSRTAIGYSDFLLMLGDEVIIPQPYLHRMIGIYKQPHVWGCVGYVVPPSWEEVMKTFSITQTHGEVQVTNMVEKPITEPDIDGSILQGTGHGIFPGTFLKYCDGAETYVDMIMTAMKEHNNIELCHIGEKYFNINTPEELAAVEGFFSWPT